VSAPRRLEFAHLRVPDLAAARAFYVEVFGLVELGEQGGTVYFGAGYDDHVDLAIESPGTGLVRLGLRLDDGDELERDLASLASHGVAHERVTDPAPLQSAAVRLAIPDGPELDLTLLSAPRYLEPHAPVRPRRGGLSPLDLDHIGVAHPDPRRFAEFLVDVLRFSLSDVIAVEDRWVAVWARRGTYHHDISMATAKPGETLSHLAWTCKDIGHIRDCCDLLSAEGIRLQAAIGRHPVGSNLFAYFRDPNGNRTELTSEVANVDAGTSTRFWTGYDETFDAWADHELPADFFRGS
jgi:catechol 2,3-dioxygenase